MRIRLDVWIALRVDITLRPIDICRRVDDHSSAAKRHRFTGKEW